MKIVLARSAEFGLFDEPLRWQQRINHPTVKLSYRSHKVLIDFQQVHRADHVILSPLEIKLRNQLEQYRSVKHPTTSLPYSSFWNVIIVVGVSHLWNDNLDCLQGCIEVDGVFQDGCLSAIRELYGSNVRLQVIISEILDIDELKPSCVISTAEMELNAEPNNMTFCRDYGLNLPAIHFENWNRPNGLNGELKVILTVEEKMLREITLAPIVSLVSSANRKMLEEGTLSDVTMVANNGAKLKAHRVFLAAESSVFLSMFQADMEASRDSIVEIPHMSEASIRNLLTHLYVKEMQFEKNDRDIIFELLHAGNIYGITSLTGIIKRFLLSTPLYWYDLEACLKLFMCGRKFTPPDDELKARAIQELRRFTGAIENSDAAKEIFRKEPEAALEMLKYALKE